MDVVNKQFCINSIHSIIHIQATQTKKVMTKTGEKKSFYILNVNGLTNYTLPFTGILQINFIQPDTTKTYLNEDWNSSSRMKVQKGNQLMFEASEESKQGSSKPLFVELLFKTE